MAGVSVNVTSVCHQLARSTLPSMASTSVLASMDGSTGWASVTSPNWRPKSACWSGESDWSRKKITWWALRAWRTAAVTGGANGTDRSMSRTSAPMVGERGCTLRLVARVTRALCPTMGPHSIRPEPMPSTLNVDGTAIAAKGEAHGRS